MGVQVHVMMGLYCRSSGAIFYLHYTSEAATLFATTSKVATEDGGAEDI